MDAIKDVAQTGNEAPVTDLLGEVLPILRSPRADTADPRLHLITRAEYHQMGKTGLFTPENRVELIEGVVVTMAPIGLWHVVALRYLTKQIILQVQEKADVDVQGAVILDDSEPQPDLVVIKAGVTGKAEAKDILLIIEVSDTTLRYDKEVKALLYAAKNIPEYWIIDHANDQIIQFLEPKDGRYKITRLWSRGETIKSTVEPILTIAVDPILGDKNS